MEDKDPLESKNAALRVARSISSSLRNRFKQAFSKPTLDLPPQQMDASRAHFGDDVFVSEGNGGFDNYYSDDLAERQRTNLYRSPWHEHVEDEDGQQLPTIIPVNMSNSSLAGSSKSRVTSWTNTTISEPTQETLIERKRLSVIQEDGGPHQPSSSAGTHIGGVSVFRKPLPSQAGRGPDAQRLYSALVRRMNQESADRAKEPLTDLQEHDEEFPESVEDRSSATAHATSGYIDQTANIWEGARSTPRYGHIKSVLSQESLYSQTTNQVTDSRNDKMVRHNDQSTSSLDLASYNDSSAHTQRWINKSNPYLVSDV